MQEKLTYKAIQKRYKDQWVLMTDFEDDKYGRIRRARVVWHGSDRDEAHRHAMSMPPGGRIGTFYMGPPIPKGVVVVV